MSETKNTIGHFVLDQKNYQTFCILVNIFVLYFKCTQNNYFQQMFEWFSKLQFVYDLFKRRNSHHIFCRCPLYQLTIGHCPQQFGFYRKFCPGLLKTIGYLGFLIGYCPRFSFIGTQLHMELILGHPITREIITKYLPFGFVFFPGSNLIIFSPNRNV